MPIIEEKASKSSNVLQMVLKRMMDELIMDIENIIVLNIVRMNLQKAGII